MFAAPGPKPATRTCEPVCCCEPPAAAVPYEIFITVPSAVVSAVLSDVGGVESTIWLECA